MNQKLTITQALKSDDVSFRAFNNALCDAGLGDLDSVNGTEFIRDYIVEKVKEGIHVSHILEAIEKENSDEGLWCIWLGNSMETPWPINTKQDLIRALSLSGRDLRRKLDFRIEE